MSDKEKESLVLIGKQQLEISRLNKRNESLAGKLSDVHSIIFSIGGPLNDNKLGFNPGQQIVFIDICKIIER